MAFLSTKGLICPTCLERSVSNRERDMGGLEDSLVTGFRRILAFDGFRTDPIFRDESHRGAEEIMKESPLFGIEVIEQRDNSGIVEPLVA